MTPGDRASCLGTSSPHALSQRLLEYSGSTDLRQVPTGLSSWFLDLSESDLHRICVYIIVGTGSSSSNEV